MGEINLGFRFAYSTISDKASSEAKTLFNAGMGDKLAEKNAFDIIEGFPIVTEWYNLIADANKLHFTDPKVAEAYWIGSELLDRSFDYSNIHNFIKKKFGVGKRVNPSRPAHHNVHVSTFGILSRPDASISQIQACKVIPITYFDGMPLSHQMETQFISERNLSLCNPFNLKTDNATHGAFHRKIYCAELNNRQMQNLIKYGYRHF